MLRLRHAIRLSLILALAGLGCGGGDGGSSSTSPTPAPSSNGDVVTVELFEFEFVPKSITVQPGQTVRWILRGNDFTHTTRDRDGAWNSGRVFTQVGATFERTFPVGEEGTTFNYSCRSHKGCCDMQGSIRVGASAPPPEPGY